MDSLRTGQHATLLDMSEHGVTASAPARPFHDRVEQIRVKRGISKIEMAALLGLARGTIDNWQKNRRPPAASTVKDVADKLGIDHDEALQLAGIMSSDGSYVTAADRNRLALEGRLQGEPAEEPTYPDWVGEIELCRYIWEGPGPEAARQIAIYSVQGYYESTGVAVRDRRRESDNG